MRKKIAVDGQLLCGKRTGMGTVVYQVLPYWQATQAELILYVPEPLDEAYQTRLLRQGWQIRVLGKANYFLWEQWLLPRAVRQDGVHVLWCPYNTAPLINMSANIRKVVTIHDVIYRKASLRSAPTLYKKAGLFYRKFVVPRAAKQASRILTISEYAKNEIMAAFPFASSKLQVIYNGAEKNAMALEDREAQAYFSRCGIKPGYILGFGSLEERKNTRRLLEAYGALPDDVKSAHPLVLYGFRNYAGSGIEKQIKARNMNHIVVLGYVSEQEKHTLYQNCSVFVFPSLAEGFGIPILEAYANHAPVITSNTTSLPEVAGDAALLVNPEDEAEICHAMQEILQWSSDKKAYRQAMADCQLAKFDWEMTAAKVLNVLLNF